MEKIFQVLNSIAQISDRDCNAFAKILSTTNLNKGDYWIEAGKKNNNIAFVEGGYLRKFYIKDGKEITDFFYFENDFTSDLPSILENSLPISYIVAMQQSTLICFSYSDFNKLCSQYPALEHLFRVILQKIFIRFYQRTESFIMESPKERYNNLMVTFPKVFQNAAQYHVASYLGISAQHLSRLRKQNTIS